MVILKLIHYYIIRAMAVYNIIQNRNIQYLFYKKKNSYVSGHIPYINFVPKH